MLHSYHSRIYVGGTLFSIEGESDRTWFFPIMCLFLINKNIIFRTVRRRTRNFKSRLWTIEKIKVLIKEN
ncbi:hypothetical protein LEP1GSC047_3960 [Leptospira inadai serovar Lyme str. 10]|uniref:Uncharacterized protein n=2 Tax=Leptospira inadai serovar Lyme TaxID=293084 RepID=V6HCA3_9LEPT|nr:hypothetical protein LEP1GSC047_3960 [Leptospira inadai serovar Lyme str. 10]